MIRVWCTVAREKITSEIDGGFGLRCEGIGTMLIGRSADCQYEKSLVYVSIYQMQKANERSLDKSSKSCQSDAKTAKSTGKVNLN